MFDLSKSFDMDSIMSEQLKKNFVLAAHLVNGLYCLTPDDLDCFVNLNHVVSFEQISEYSQVIVLNMIDRSTYVCFRDDIEKSPFSFVLKEVDQC